MLYLTELNRRQLFDERYSFSTILRFIAHLPNNEFQEDISYFHISLYSSARMPFGNFSRSCSELRVQAAAMGFLHINELLANRSRRNKIAGERGNGPIRFRPIAAAIVSDKNRADDGGAVSRSLSCGITFHELSDRDSQIWKEMYRWCREYVSKSRRDSS